MSEWTRFHFSSKLQILNYSSLLNELAVGGSSEEEDVVLIESLGWISQFGGRQRKPNL